MNSLTICGALVCAALLAGCHGEPYKMNEMTIDPAKYDVLGEAHGGKTGIMLFQCIPIGHNDKIRTACERAIAVKGGDELVNVTIQESWWWAWVLNGYRVEVDGTVVKRKG